jgi:hypothetical protein
VQTPAAVAEAVFRQAEAAEEVHFRPLELEAVRVPHKDAQPPKPKPQQETNTADSEGKQPHASLLASLSHDQDQFVGLPESSFPVAGAVAGGVSVLPSPYALAPLTEDPVEVRAFKTIAKYARQIQASIPRMHPQHSLTGIWHPQQVLRRSRLYLSPDELEAITKQKAKAEGEGEGTSTGRNFPVPAESSARSSQQGNVGEDSASGVEVLSLPSDAWMPITYDEGFPTINGSFFWERIPGEPLIYFKLFRAYLDQFKDPRGQKARPSFRAKQQVYSRGGRSLFLLQESLPDDLFKLYSIAKLEAIYYLNYWSDRVAAYDRYIDTQISYRLAHVAGDMDARHLQAGQVLFEQAITLLLERVNDLDHKTLLDLVKYSVGLERTSLGRTESNAVPRNGPSVVVNTLTQVAAGQQGYAGAGGGGGGGPGGGFPALPSARGGAAGYAGANTRSPGGVVAVTRDRSTGQGQGQGQGPAGDGAPVDIMSALRDPSTAALLQKLALQLQGADTERGSNARGQS